MTTPDPESKPPRKRAQTKKTRPTIAVHGIEIEHGLRLETIESPEEIRSRLLIEEAKAAQTLWRDRTVLRVCLFALPVLVTYCLVVLLLPGVSAEARTWAASTLTGIATGVVGYALGQSGKSS